MADEFVYCYYVGGGVATAGEGAWDGNIPSKALGSVCYRNCCNRINPVFYAHEAITIHLFSILVERFFKSIWLLLSLLFVINVALDFGLSSMLRRCPKQMYREWNRIIHDTIDADLVVMGSSRAREQYNPYIMDSLLSVNSYNLGLDGSHVRRQIVKYKVYHHYQKSHPRLLVINFDYYGNWTKDGGEGGFQREQYFPYFANSYMRNLIKGQEPFSIGELWLPMFRYYRHGVLNLLEDIHNHYNQDCWYKGCYRCKPQKWDGTKLAQMPIVKFETLQDAEEKFDAFLCELQNEGVQVVFVSSPIYIEVTERTVNLKDFYFFREHFSKKYNIPVLDYLHDSLCYDTACFYNAMHLNKRGAEMFTVKLCRDLDSLGIFKN